MSLRLDDVGSHDNDSSRASAWLKEALTLFKQLSNREGIGWTLLSLGRAAQTQGDQAQSTELYRASLALFRELDHQEGVAQVLLALKRVALVPADDTASASRSIEHVRHTREPL